MKPYFLEHWHSWLQNPMRKIVSSTWFYWGRIPFVQTRSVQSHTRSLVFTAGFPQSNERDVLLE